MGPKSRKFILDLMRKHNVMRLATVRRDGYPQTTTVAYANDGLTLYFACDRASQKVRNIKYSKKVSLTIDRDCADWNKIKGLSMAARAQELTRPAEIKRALALLARKFPAMADMSEEDLAATAVVKVTPKVVSVIDYTKGFGHSELVKV
jgi:nitroimidazol reductase NimA-like FMN-containing flavoprotein (pyridoxamine 5'-phosphate oxidase superfamily)